MLTFLIIMGTILYLIFGVFVLGFETGLEPCTETEILLYVLGWPLYYAWVGIVYIGKLPFKLGVWCHNKCNKEVKK